MVGCPSAARQAATISHALEMQAQVARVRDGRTDACRRVTRPGDTFRCAVNVLSLAPLLPIATALGLAGCGLLSMNGLTGGTPDTGAGESTDEDAAGESGADAPPTGADATSPPHDASSVDADAPEAAPNPCDGGLLFCNGTCVDPASDPANCNGCGNVCATGTCGTKITESLGSAPTAWTFNGSATYNTFAPSAELTPIANDQAGTFIYDNPIVVDAFDVTFEFRMGLNGGTRGDGIGFMIEQTGAQAVGGEGAGLGMTGLTGYGAELDLYDNAVCGDTNGDHVGVDDLALCNHHEGTPTSLFASGDLSAMVDLGDAHFHQAEVTLAGGALSVSVDGTMEAQAVALPNLQTGAQYYFGFAGGTGGLVQADGGAGGYRQEVKDIVITFPTPRCL
jgi:hypothetical protein